MLRFLRVYFDRPLRDVLRDESATLQRLDAEAQRLLARYRRKYAPGGA